MTCDNTYSVNRKTIFSMVFLMLSMFLLSVSSATLNLPSTAMQGETWEIELDCPEINGWNVPGVPNDASDECLIEWTGPESGSFIENDADPDPDVINKEQNLDIPGTYTFTIKECPTGAPASCGAVLDTDSITISGDSTPGTLWLRYRSIGPNMRVSGIAPTGATKVQILVFNENNSAQVVPISAVTPDAANGNYYIKNINLSGVTPQTLNIRATFRDASDNTMSTAEAVLEALKMDEMQQQIDQIEVDVSALALNISDLEAEISSLQTANFLQWLAIAGIEWQVQGIYSKIATINGKIATINANISALQVDVSSLQTGLTSLELRVSTIEADLLAMNHGTINIRFDETAMELEVWGEAPLGSTNAVVKIYEASDPGPGGTPVYTGTDAIMYDAVNDSRYAFNNSTGDPIDLSGFNPEILGVEVSFGGMQSSYKVSAVLEALLVLELESQVAALDAQLQLADANIVALWQDSANQAQRIADIEAEITVINNKLDVINGRLDDLEGDVAWLKMRVSQLQNQINFLRRTMKAMNHATINIFYNKQSNTLMVWGEAAEGTIGDVMLVMVSTDMADSYSDTVSVSAPQNEFMFTVNTTVLQEGKSYNVFAAMTSQFRPSGAPAIYFVGTIFDNLAIENLQDRLTELEEKVEKLDDGTVEFNYNSADDEVTIEGEAPTEATCAKISVWTASGSFVASSTTGISQNTSKEDYSVTASTDQWPQEALNVYTSFYEKTSWFWGCKDRIATVNDTFDSMLGEDLFGFRDITTSSYVSSYYVNRVKIPISFALKPDRGGLLGLFGMGGTLYRIEYQTNPSGAWKELVSCSWYDEGLKTYKNGKIELNSTGVKEIKLRAKRCLGNTVDYESYVFRVRHVDLKDTLNASTTIVTPVENSDTTLPYPFGSIESNVYWTQSGTVPLVSYLITNTDEDRPVCEVYYYDDFGVERHIGNYQTTQDNVRKWGCDAASLNFGTGEWASANHAGNYTKVRVYNGVVGQPDSFDEVKVGVDDASPSIISINPDEAGIMNGIYRWFSHITDDLSGLAQVNFYLIEKDGINYCYDGNCHTGDGNIVWAEANVDFNSGLGKFFFDVNTLNFADGDYNVAFEATDIAGNYARLEIDPIIDNTKPVIHTVTVLPADPKLRTDSIVIEANVTDNLSGVDSVWATVTRPDLVTVDKIFLSLSGGLYKGIYPTDTSSDQGKYTVQVDANDFATNVAATVSTDFNLFYSYIVQISLDDYSIYPGTKVQVDGNVFKEDGSVIGDFNIFLTLPDGNTLVAVDANTGMFSYTIDTTRISAGNYDINAYATTSAGIESINWKILSVTNQPAQPEPVQPQSPGGGGARRLGFYCGDNKCLGTETCDSCSQDCGVCEVEELPPPEPELEPEPPVDTGPEPTESGPTFTEEPPTTPEQGGDQTGPTGFFGLAGNQTSILLGLLFLLIIGTVFGYKKLAKK